MAQHRHLIRKAHAAGYPLHLLRLSLMAYRLKRTVGVDGLYSDLVVAANGITTGLGFACTELRVMLIAVMDDLLKFNPYVDLVLVLYVDDLAIQFEHESRQEDARVVASVTDQAIAALENLGAVVSDQKSVTNASSWALAKATTKLIRRKKVSSQRIASSWAPGSRGDAEEQPPS